MNIIYKKHSQELIVANYVEAMVNTSLDKDYPAKIRINNHYGFGMLFIVENIMTLINFLDSGLDGNNSTLHLASANHVVLVTSACSVRKHRATENFLIDAWQNHFISHLLVLLNDCGVRILHIMAN